MSISYEDWRRLENLGTAFIVEGKAPRCDELVKVFLDMNISHPEKYTKEDMRARISLSEFQDVRIPVKYLPDLIEALQNLKSELDTIED